MNYTDFLSLGYRKYKDQEDEIKNNYSLSFEDLESFEPKQENKNKNKYENTEYVESDICDCSDDWSPVGMILKKNQKTYYERACNYITWASSLSCMGLICYWTINDLYRE